MYDQAWLLYQDGPLAAGQQEADAGYRRFQFSDPAWAARFLLLESQTMLRRGMNDQALHLVDAYLPGFNDPEQKIQKLAIEAEALSAQQVSAADRKLAEAEDLCRTSEYKSCGGVLRMRGNLALRQGQIDEGRRYFLECLRFANAYQDKWARVGALNNLGYTYMQLGRLDEAVDTLKSAQQGAAEVGSNYWGELAKGNLGWAYYQLGDDERALELFQAARTDAATIGGFRDELKWITAAGNVYRDTGDFAGAEKAYRMALDLAERIGNGAATMSALEDLAQISVVAGELDQAEAYIHQATPMELAGGNRLTAYLMLTEGLLAAARGRNQEAESLFLEVRKDPTSPTSLRLEAGLDLGDGLELRGNLKGAEQTYKATLNEFDAARAQLKSEESTLPFLANAANIYDDYIHLLVQEGRVDEALALADRGRARTLAESLGVIESKRQAGAAAMDPRRIASKTGATLLFYLLCPHQSYLWAITPAKVAVFPLPAQQQIAVRIDRYRKALLDLDDPIRDGNEDGEALYKLLVAPAAKMIRPGAPVVILADGPLTQLNFETLLAPSPDKVPASAGGVPSTAGVALLDRRRDVDVGSVAGHACGGQAGEANGWQAAAAGQSGYGQRRLSQSSALRAGDEGDREAFSRGRRGGVFRSASQSGCLLRQQSGAVLLHSFCVACDG